MSQYRYWTEEERCLLLESIKSVQHTGKRVNWDAIAEKLPNRTKMQCKSYFTNIMKKNTDVNLLKYHIWTRDEQE